MELVRAYHQEVQRLLTQLHHEDAALMQAGTLIAQSLAAGGVLHVLGSGHSALVAADVVGRSGSLVPINQILDKTEDMAERLPGYGQVLLKHYHQQYQLLAGEVLVIVSNSGVNPLGIDAALEAKARGLHPVALTNVRQSRALTSRHPSGKRLFEVADVILDNHAAFGEAAVAVPHTPYTVGAVPTLSGVYLMHALVMTVVELLVTQGITPPLLISENMGHAEADAHNARLRARYQGRLRRAGV